MAPIQALHSAWIYFFYSLFYFPFSFNLASGIPKFMEMNKKVPVGKIDFMRRAIQLSEEKMMENSGGPFGAVIVKDNKIIAEGYNQVISINDPTAHAEIVAIRKACEYLNTFQLSEAEIFCSCEPCPMCFAAIHWARIKKVYYSNTRKDAQKIGFDDNTIYEELTKNNNQRKIPSIQFLSMEGKTAFKTWEEKIDKTPY